MSNSKVSPITISILGKEFQVASPEDEHQKLLHAANALDLRMREIRESGKVVGLERIAVMAALNLSYELSNTSNLGDGELSLIDAHAKQMANNIEHALMQSDQIELTNN